MICRKKKMFVLLTFVVALLVVCIWIAWENSAPMFNKITITSDKIPNRFSNYRIVQISDFHNMEFDEHNEKLIKLLKECKPDSIVFTGDLIDSYHTQFNISIECVKQTVQIAPSYYVTGNREARIEAFDEFLVALKRTGVMNNQHNWMVSV